MEYVILVDQNDVVTGTAEKMDAHRVGLLHRAFSIFIFNESGEMLIQQRASGKYHSADKFSNTCCSHPRPGEKIDDAARRRLSEEMGIDCLLTHAFVLPYRAEFDNGLVENEYDHIYIGQFSDDPKPDSEEVKSWKWIKPEKLRRWIKNQPQQFTPWFELAVGRVIDCFDQWEPNSKTTRN